MKILVEEMHLKFNVTINLLLQYMEVFCDEIQTLRIKNQFSRPAAFLWLRELHEEVYFQPSLSSAFLSSSLSFTCGISFFTMDKQKSLSLQYIN
jgi:hypothetical protein